MTIYLIIPYFGTFPNYFQLYLDSLGKNADILKVLLFTDIEATFNYPPNLVKIKMSLDAVRSRLQNFLSAEYQIEATNLINKPYKLCDIRPVFHILFADYLQDVSDMDFVGWGDLDVIYGKLSKFIDMNVDIIGGFHGHFTAIRHMSSMQSMYKEIDNYLEICTNNHNFIADEKALRKPLNAHLQAGRKMCYINASCTDIVPPCFYHLFRQKQLKNFFNAMRPELNIKELHYNRQSGELTTYYDNGTVLDTSYCHLQKRVMELPFTNYNHYYIRENIFSLHPLNGIRLHIPGVPYTITRSDWSHDAFTGKVQRFGPMMRSLGYEVYHYGVETSQTNVDVHIDLLSLSKWEELRVQSLMELNNVSKEEAINILGDHRTQTGILANWSTPLFKEFNRELKKNLQKYYRSVSTDLFCNPLGASYDAGTSGLNLVEIEFGIGYRHSCKNFRIFEAHSWLSATLARQGKDPHNYWFTIPHSFDIKEFRYSPGVKKERPKCGFLGRIISGKGCGIIKEIAKRFPHVDFVLCGQGDPAPFLETNNITYMRPISGAERSSFLGSCDAVLCLAKYLEPFGCTVVEAQLCGTPVISTDFGGPVETIEQFKTGLRGHVLADFCHGVQLAIDGYYDRQYIRDRAVKLYGMYNVAVQYDYVFRTILEIYNGSGWYSPNTHIDKLMD